MRAAARDDRDHGRRRDVDGVDRWRARPRGRRRRTKRGAARDDRDHGRRDVGGVDRWRARPRGRSERHPRRAPARRGPAGRIAELDAGRGRRVGRGPHPGVATRGSRRRRPWRRQEGAWAHRPARRHLGWCCGTLGHVFGAPRARSAAVTRGEAPRESCRRCRTGLGPCCTDAAEGSRGRSRTGLGPCCFDAADRSRRGRGVVPCGAEAAKGRCSRSRMGLEPMLL